VIVSVFEADKQRHASAAWIETRIQWRQRPYTPMAKCCQ